MTKMIKRLGKFSISVVLGLISGIGVLWATECIRNTSEAMKTAENAADSENSEQEGTQ